MTENDTSSGRTSRRTFLQAASGAVALGGVAGLVGAQQDGPQLIVLDGRTAGWEGVAPSSIAGATNPTLPLVPGQDYRVRWTNVDGQAHNFVVLGPDGQDLVSTDVISTEGATQTVTFTASERMAEYYCEVHPTTMRGDVEIVQQQQLEPVNESRFQNRAEAEAENESPAGQDLTGNVSQPVGLGDQTWPNNTSIVQDFREQRLQQFQNTGNGTTRGNLTYATNATVTQTQDNATNATQGNRTGAVSANDVRQVARAPGMGILATLGGVFAGLAAMSKRDDD